MIRIFPATKKRRIAAAVLGSVTSLVYIALYLSNPCKFSARDARESVLRQDLYVLRSAIDQYTLDRQKAPQSLEDLVSANYLREIPRDPMTCSPITWETVQEDSLMAINQQQPGIVDVHSGSQGLAKDGTAYCSW